VTILLENPPLFLSSIRAPHLKFKLLKSWVSKPNNRRTLLYSLNFPLLDVAICSNPFTRHKLVDDQVKATASTPTLPSKNSFLFSRKKECDNILKEWQVSFSSSQKKGQLFLDFEDEKEQVLKPTYVKGGSWLPSIGFSNSLYTRFTHMTTGHAPISEYCQRFFPNSPTSCPCSKVDVQTREHIVMQCDRHKQSTRL